MLASTNEILQKTGLIDKLPPEAKDRLTGDIGDILEKKLMTALVTNMSEEQIKEFEAKVDKNDPNLEQYLTEAVPNNQEILRQVVEDFTQEVEGLL